MDKSGLRKSIHWILLHYGMRALLEETIEEIKDHDEEHAKKLRENLEKTLSEYEARYGK